jgi:hypothetical protein
MTLDEFESETKEYLWFCYLGGEFDAFCSAPGLDVEKMTIHDDESEEEKWTIAAWVWCAVHAQWALHFEIIHIQNFCNK